MCVFAHFQIRSNSGLMVQLHGDHHAVGHALGAHVVTGDVGDVGHVVAGRVVDALRGVVAVEELLPGGIEPGGGLRLGFAEQFVEEIGIGPGVDGAGGDRPGDGGQRQHGGEQTRTGHGEQGSAAPPFRS